MFFQLQAWSLLYITWERVWNATSSFNKQMKLEASKCFWSWGHDFCPILTSIHSWAESSPVRTSCGQSAWLVDTKISVWEVKSRNWQVCEESRPGLSRRLNQGVCADYPSFGFLIHHKYWIGVGHRPTRRLQVSVLGLKKLHRCVPTTTHNWSWRNSLFFSRCESLTCVIKSVLVFVF